MNYPWLQRILHTDAGWGPLALLAASAALLVSGAGRLSLDAVLTERRLPHLASAF